MASIDDVVAGVVAKISEIPGLNVQPYFVGSITPPTAIVGVPNVPDYHVSMNSAVIQLEPTITVFTGSNTDLEGQRELAGYVNPFGDKSIKAKIEADKTLGVAGVSNCIVREFRALTLEEWQVFQYYGGVFTLQLYMKGKP